MAVQVVVHLHTGDKERGDTHLFTCFEAAVPSIGETIWYASMVGADAHTPTRRYRVIRVDHSYRLYKADDGVKYHAEVIVVEED